MWWLIGDVVAHRICGGYQRYSGSSDMWLLIGYVVIIRDIVAHRICGGSSDM